MRKPLLQILLLAVLLAAGCDKQHPDAKSALRQAGAHTLSSFDPPTAGEKITPAHGIKFEHADLAQVLNTYAEISGRSIIRATNLPEIKITFSNQTPMSPVEILQALDTVLAAQNITTVVVGSQYLKVVNENEAQRESAPIIELRPDQLPDSNSYLTYTVNLKKGVSLDRAISVLPLFAHMPNSIIGIPAATTGRKNTLSSNTNIAKVQGLVMGWKDNDTLILRDYACNVRRMLQVLEKLEQQ